MQTESQPSDGQTLPFLKIWTESFSKLAQAAFSFSPDAVPPEMLRQIRTGVFQALSQSWEEFLRSPEFLEATKQMMDQAIAFRKLSTDMLTKARHDLAGVAQEDVDGAVVVLQRIERRVLDRLEGVSRQITELNKRLNGLEARVPAPTPKPRPVRTPEPKRKRAVLPRRRTPRR